MKVSHHAQLRRDASYAIIREEISTGIEISEELARTILHRADNRRFKDDIDKFILTKDLSGLYILTQDSDKSWMVITFIDVSDLTRQNLLRKLFPELSKEIPKPVEKIKEVKQVEAIEINLDFSLSKAIILRASLDELTLIKEVLSKKVQDFKDIEKYPYFVDIDCLVNKNKRILRIFKPSRAKHIRVSLVD